MADQRSQRAPENRILGLSRQESRLKPNASEITYVTRQKLHYAEGTLVEIYQHFAEDFGSGSRLETT